MGNWEKSEAGKKYHREYVAARRAADPETARAVGRAEQQKRRDTKPKQVMLNAARDRAAKRGTAFNITVDDFEIPEVCPVLGIPLIKSSGSPTDNSPTLDELVHGGGYIRGNIQVMSYLANSCKRNLKPEQLLMLADWSYKTFSDVPLPFS